ncbi:uncharacterized protein BDZ99DRAFT_469776 [Mytilinidion resinicola]|uniref:Uncharacterized protein n=1 Tax=Mytilinidion resinicola TaxID=574789 RepID=A0A6A6Y021_9PEZI|nr:uncharacterized protein BDZ99DRAFT_469776 [Mytilinidion resinicola]KAF2801344.1 hypothetical protein BDZ99DRAFT_469776 [Mytilinidion resinicola]
MVANIHTKASSLPPPLKNWKEVINHVQKKNWLEAAEEEWLSIMDSAPTYRAIV